MKEILLEIKKSKFYGFLYEISNQEQVSEILQQLKKQHKKATHICYAYKIYDGAEIVKFSDDGEPSGTAGRPILGVIEKKGKTNVMVVVVRYFGGIKLGAGGLVRAYTKTASEVFSV
ncbi:MAG: YigZ family protein [Clostridia bacterium]|nr:YigZ family protein [Clostridia bacterium]